MSRTDAAILGMLTVEPMTGYDMKRFCEQSLIHFWHESYGNLYPRLKRLETRGLIRGRREAREGAPDATVYTLTGAGRALFGEWMRDDPAPERVRSELVLKIFFGSHSRPELVAEWIAEHEQVQRRTLASYAEVEILLREGMADRPEAPFWLMALRRGQLLSEARLKWCEECVEALGDLEPGETDDA